jgi:hypothetical protein
MFVIEVRRRNIATRCVKVALCSSFYPRGSNRNSVTTHYVYKKGEMNDDASERGLQNSTPGTICNCI